MMYHHQGKEGHSNGITFQNTQCKPETTADKEAADTVSVPAEPGPQLLPPVATADIPP